MNHLENILSDAVNDFDEIDDIIGLSCSGNNNEDCEEEPDTVRPSTTPSSSISVYNNDTKNSTVVNTKAAGLTADGRRKWKKPEGKPKRPLSAYNFFFRFAREIIVSGNGEHGNVQIQENLVDIILRKTMDPKKGKRRQHRKSHGKISFCNLAKTIGGKWKSMNDETRFIFEKRAYLDKIRYDKELKQWKEKMDEERNQKSHNNILSSIPTLEQCTANTSEPASLTSSANDYIGCFFSSRESFETNAPSFLSQDCGHILWSTSYPNNSFHPNQPILQSSLDMQGINASISTMPIVINLNSSCPEEQGPVHDEFTCFMEAFERE